MKKGIEIEPVIIERLARKQETGNTVRRCGFFVSSPDGITAKGNLIEVKYTVRL